MNGEWWITFMVLGEFLGIAGIVWIVAHYRSKRLRQSSDERLRVLESLGSGKELMEYLDTEKGEKILRFFAAPQPDPFRGLALGSGVALLSISLGLGFLTLSAMDVLHNQEGFLVSGILCLFGGVGLLAAVAFGYKLARAKQLNGQGLPFADKGDD
jgi:hypothetical protein